MLTREHFDEQGRLSKRGELFLYQEINSLSFAIESQKPNLVTVCEGEDKIPPSSYSEVQHSLAKAKLNVENRQVIELIADISLLDEDKFPRAFLINSTLEELNERISDLNQLFLQHNERCVVSASGAIGVASNESDLEAGVRRSNNTDQGIS